MRERWRKMSMDLLLIMFLEILMKEDKLIQAKMEI